MKNHSSIAIVVNEFLRYVVVGGIAFIADFGTLVFSEETFLKGMSFSIYLATAMGFFVGLAVNYFLSLAFVFTQEKDRHKGRTVKAFAIFGLVGLLGLLWTEIGMWAGVEVLEWNYMVVKVLVTVAVLAWNYLGRKLLVFSSMGIGG